MLCTARSRDIGEGGMCLLMAMELVVDDEIWVDFTLDGVRVYAQARVRYRSGFQYGVQFMTLSSKQREAIRAICGVGEAVAAL